MEAVRRTERLLNHFSAPLSASSTSSAEPWRQHFVLTPEVANALKSNAPVVALESTVISHGLPYPDNIALAKEMERIVRNGGATPATIAIIDGKICIGLSESNLERLAQPNRSRPVQKVSVRDIAQVVAQKGDGATTVAATSFLAAKCGIRVFATGGIGGVHRDGHETMDISADLPTLADTQIAVVCAGAKSILDLPRTLEYLETLGVCVVGFGTQEFPAFFTRTSGLPLECSVESASEVAQILSSSVNLGIKQGVLVCVPIDKEHEADGKKIEEATERALAEAMKKNITGKKITPFLLSRVNELTAGASKKANLALLKQNAAVAASIAVEFSRLMNKPAPRSGSRRVSCIVIGGAAIDLISKPKLGSTVGRFTGEGLSLPGSIELKFGGVGRNFAEMLHKSGISVVSLITALGFDGQIAEHDVFGRMVLADSKQLGLDVVPISVENARTSFYNACLYSDGELRSAVCDFACMEQVSPMELVQAVRTTLQNSNSPSLAVLDANGSPAALKLVVSELNARSIPILALATSAPKVVRWIPVLRELSYLILNQHELDAVLKAALPSSKDSSLSDKLKALHTLCPATVIVCTIGADGALLIQPQSELVIHVPAAPVRVVRDVTGAGDSLSAGFAAGILLGKSLSDALQIGTVWAAATIESGSLRSSTLRIDS